MSFLKDPTLERKVTESDNDGHLRIFLVVAFVVALALAIAARLAVAWSPVLTSFSFSVPDDAYYYFTIARNIAAGHGTTFDGLTPTNGFHPLWMAMIVPLWAFTNQPDTLPIHLALTLGAILDVVTMAGIWWLAGHISHNRVIAGLAVLSYAFNPYNTAASVNGLETSLSAALFVWSLASYWRLREISRPGWRNWLFLGMIWALLLLARTDYVIILVPCAVDLVWQQRRHLRGIWAMSLGGLLWLPWITWNFATFGSLSQVSGNAYPYYLHAIWEAQEHTAQQLLTQQARMAYGIFANLARLSGFDKAIVSLVIFCAAMLFVAWKARSSPKQVAAPKWESLVVLVWPTVGAVGLLILHGLVRWMYLPWYFVPATILLVLWFTVLLTWLGQRKMQAVALVAGLFLGYQLSTGFVLVQQGGMWASQAQVVIAGTSRLAKLCGNYDTIGISDSGYYGYFLPCRVVNLDGVVNNRAYDSILEGRFRRYLDASGIQYVELNEIIQQVVSLREGPVPIKSPFAPEVGNQKQ